MNFENKNIEDFFKDTFENYQVTPSDDLWGRISHDLDSPENSNLPLAEYAGLRKVFENYVVEPSSNLWNNILNSLETRRTFIGSILYFIRKELSFVYNRRVNNFIISCLLLFGFAMIPDYPNMIHSSKKVELFKNDKLEKLISEKVATHLGNYTPALISTENNNKPQHENTASSVNLTENQVLAPEVNYNSENKTKLIANNGSQATDNKPLNNKIDKESVVQNTHHESSILNNENVTLAINEKDQILKLPKEDNIQVVRENYHLSAFKPLKLSLNPPVTYNANYKAVLLNMDFAKSFDDVLDSAYRKWSKIFNQHIYNSYVEVFSMAYYSTAEVLKIQNLVSQPQTRITETFNAQPGTRLGINIGYNKGSFVFETGIAYENIESYQTFNLTWRKTDTITTNHNDSIGFIFNVIDNTYKTLYRLRWDTTYNASEISKDYAARVSYKIIEVPVMIGYQFFNENSSLNIKTGIKADFIISTTQLISTVDENVSSYVTLPPRTSVDWLWVLSINYNYGLSDRLCLSITPSLSYFLNSFYQDYPIVLHPVSVGIGVGIKYKF